MPKKLAKNRFQIGSQKKPRSIEDVDGIEGKKFQWNISKHYIDIDHDGWGWGNLSFVEFFGLIVHRFNDYETMTWQDLLNRKNCHPMPIQSICGKAQTRISARHKDIDTLYSLDVGELERVWGFRDRGMFYLIWYDPEHTVCPITK